MRKKAAVLLSMALMAGCFVPQMLSLAETPDKTEITEEKKDQEAEEEKAEKEQEEDGEETEEKETKEEKETEKEKKAKKETKAEDENEDAEENEDKVKADEEKKNESRPEDFRIRGKKLNSYAGNSKILRIPDNVTEIADEALMGNSTAEEIYIPDSVKTVGFGAFSNMSSLKKVHLGNGFDADMIDIFLGSMNIEEYETDEQSGDFYAEDGVLYINSEIGTAAYYPAAKTDTVYAVPEHVSALFLNGNRYLNTLSLSGNVKRIDFNGGMDVDIVPASLRQITINGSNPYFYVDSQGVLKDRNSDTSVFSPFTADKTNAEK